MSIIQQKVTRHAKQKNVTPDQEKKPSAEPTNDHMLQLADENFKTAIINVTRFWEKRAEGMNRWEISRDLQT